MIVFKYLQVGHPPKQQVVFDGGATNIGPSHCGCGNRVYNFDYIPASTPLRRAANVVSKRSCADALSGALLLLRHVPSSPYARGFLLDYADSQISGAEIRAIGDLTHRSSARNYGAYRAYTFSNSLPNSATQRCRSKKTIARKRHTLRHWHGNKSRQVM